MICFPNCKINLGLHIVDKRTDGFHNIESIFYPVKLCDILEVIENKDINESVTFQNTGLIVEGPVENNLCVKAYYLLKKKFKIPPVKIHLHKIIPFEAGLGGGSSDAAFMLKCLNELFGLHLSDDKLLQFAMELGSDCGFFIRNQPSFVTGRGEKLKYINVNLSGYCLVLLNPGIHISTREAYGSIIVKKPTHSLIDFFDTPLEEWKDSVKNDFETELLIRYPVIKECKDLLYKSGAVYASMTGSGSSVYGIFNQEPDLSDSLISKHIVWQGKLSV
ncbi:MAG: 4-(cytidine 5'-diphospho)-2-C-methyl-D-erythritol kinase [Bacteroidales bacterium]|nr:4-(cytidine 5'-diphospho)-2-C-methyl-D-erythritol kinase [Bacteroidales bacterium]